MADPITVDHFRVLAVWQMRTDLPEDVIVNSLVFKNQDTTGLATVAPRIATALDNFYFALQPSGRQVSSFLNGSLFSSLTYKVYDLGEAPPRTVTEVPSAAYGTGIFGTGVPLPEEVAITVTWQTEHKGPRGRGRTYLGGLDTNTVGEDASTGRVMIDNQARLTIAQAAKTLLWNNGQDVELAVLGADGPHRATKGYVDDSFDTQRRRGPEAVVRTVFSSTAP